MKLHVHHRTAYRYAAAVRDSFNEARLQPASADGQVCHNFKLAVTPPAGLTAQRDFLGNHVHFFGVTEPHIELAVEATSVVTTTSEGVLPADFGGPSLAATAQRQVAESWHDFLQPSRFVDPSPESTALARSVTGGILHTWEAALSATRFVHREFAYRPASTHVHTPMSTVLLNRCGVCQDFAHVAIGLCRALRIPARYVSGYLYNGPVDQLRGAQASHAWLEVFLQGYGWHGLDPTNDQQADERYVKIAVGRDYSDVSPLRGTYRGTPDRKLSVEVLVESLEAVAP